MLNQRRTSPRGVTFYILIAYIVLPSATGAVVGDLNLDGVVDFDDFFILADNFGKVGGPTPSDIMCEDLANGDLRWSATMVMAYVLKDGMTRDEVLLAKQGSIPGKARCH